MSDHLKEWFLKIGADEKGIIKGDEGHSLSTGKEVSFLFTPENAPRLGEDDLPGVPPFRRGVYPTMYRGKLWTMRQYAGFGTAQETNRRFKYLLEQGQTGLSVAFDLPTQMGFDPDSPLSRGEVGRVGVSVFSIEDMRELFSTIPLDKVSVSMTINATAPILLAMLICVAEEQGVDRRKLSGTTQNDILKEYVARGTYCFPPEPSLFLASDLIAFCTKEMPKWNPISVSGYHMREAGADACQELAFTLCNALAYVRATKALGLGVDEFAPRFSFFFGCHNHFFEEVAKFRAGRVLWAKLMREKEGAKDERSLSLRFHTQTAGSTLTSKEPLNNVVRVALQALAAVLGGTQSLHTNAWDEALSLPSEQSAKLALRTQQIIAYESHVADFCDPLGGAYLVEALTEMMIGEVQALIENIEAMGGIVEAIKTGFVAKAIADSAYRQQQAIEKGQARVVGVNILASEGKGARIDTKIHKKLEVLERKQLRNLERLRRTRDSSLVQESLEKVKEACSKRTQVVPAIIDAVKARATLGEIVSAMERVFRRYTPESSGI
jgi:methylmalonyl-CoA mutase N-terminal domain/subunit